MPRGRAQPPSAAAYRRGSTREHLARIDESLEVIQLTLGALRLAQTAAKLLEHFPSAQFERALLAALLHPGAVVGLAARHVAAERIAVRIARIGTVAGLAIRLARGFAFAEFIALPLVALLVF